MLSIKLFNYWGRDLLYAQKGFGSGGLSLPPPLSLHTHMVGVAMVCINVSNNGVGPEGFLKALCTMVGGARSWKVNCGGEVWRAEGPTILSCHAMLGSVVETDRQDRLLSQGWCRATCANLHCHIIQNICRCREGEERDGSVCLEFVYGLVYFWSTIAISHSP